MWPVGPESERAVDSQEVRRWQQMGEEVSQRDPEPGACGGFAEATDGFGAWVMTENWVGRGWGWVEQKRHSWLKRRDVT